MTKIIRLKDLPGCRGHEHAEWLVGPVGHHRDSDAVEESNWRAMCAEYARVDPGMADHEIHYFRHWAVGWVEEVAYRPGSKVAEVAAQLRARLDIYPVLDEFLLAEVEHEMGLDEE